VYKVKYKEDVRLEKYKAQLVAKGFLMEKTLTMRRSLLLVPTTQMSTIQLVLAMETQLG